jgi:2-furoyl-CoA dehydrogenase large subunit
MSVPVCVANAIADALGVENVPLPATPRRIHEILTAPSSSRVEAAE